MTSIWGELKRRKVVRVAAAYAVVAWLLIQVIVSVEEPLNLPEWTDSLVILLLAVGFFVALILAWAFELTPDGIAITSDESSESARPASFAAAKYITTAIVAALIGAISYWFVNRDTESKWLLNEAIPEIEVRLDTADWDRAYTLVKEAEARVPDSQELDNLWTRVSWRVTIPSDPVGATVYRQSYDADDDEWEELGQTPLVDIHFPYGLSRIRFELDGFRALNRTLGGGHINWAELGAGGSDGLLVRVDQYKLDTDESLPVDMVRVSGWTTVIDGESSAFNDFFLSRYEVSNAQFKEFVDVGGYEQRNLWDPIVVNGETVPWEDAMVLFMDRTGRPGPSSWEAGDYLAGTDNMPVSGVSWYEAKAYARYAGRELPTKHHWQQALGTAEFPWLLPASNFTGTGPRAVTDSRAMSFTGAFDMTGNVREWSENAIDDNRIILGGSWNDPYYIAGVDDISAPPLDRSAGNGIRLAITEDEPIVAMRARAPIVSRTIESPAEEEDPISNEVYAAYSRIFDYDKRPLNVSIDDVETTRIWKRERVSLDAGYGSERFVAYLYLPANASGPFQTVVYWPGWDTFRLDDVDEYFAKQVDFIVKSGRAVAFPIYKGTFERRVGNQRSRPRFDTAAYRDNTIDTVKDLRRTIDYLETRRDIDPASFTYFGYSWGGVNGPTAIAQEPRIKLAVINIGLLPPMKNIPEVDPVNALPRVRVPVLMLSGEFDGLVPLDNARRYFDLVGAPPADKKHVVAIGGHFIPRDLLIRETLAWLDKYLGTGN